MNTPTAAVAAATAAAVTNKKRKLANGASIDTVTAANDLNANNHETDQRDDRDDEEDRGYLDTIDRSSLNYDNEQVCSVTLSTTNVYACLVCGVFLQGRGVNSPAYEHSLSSDHHVFMHLGTLDAYILPDRKKLVANNADGEKVLDDIRNNFSPRFTRMDLKWLDETSLPDCKRLDMQQKSYIPGYIGLCSPRMYDSIDVVVQLLAHVQPLRDVFLLDLPSLLSKSAALGTGNPSVSSLTAQLGLVIRRMWNSKAQNAHSSAHAFVMELVKVAGKRFNPAAGKCDDPIDLLALLLNKIHTDLGSLREVNASMATIVHRMFQGTLRRNQSDADKKTIPFLMLSVDATKSVIDSIVSSSNNNNSDNDGSTSIPQVSLMQLLERKYARAGTPATMPAAPFSITSLPGKYLIVAIRRRSASRDMEGSGELGRAIVTFAPNNLNLAPLLPANHHSEHSTFRLVSQVILHGDIGAASSSSGSANAQRLSSKSGSKSMTHDDLSVRYSIQLRHLASDSDRWLHIDGLTVEEIQPQLAGLSESCIQVWERL